MNQRDDLRLVFSGSLMPFSSCRREAIAVVDVFDAICGIDGGRQNSVRISGSPPWRLNPLVEKLQVSLSPMVLVAAGTPGGMNPPPPDRPAARAYHQPVREHSARGFTYEGFLVRSQAGATESVHESCGHQRVIAFPGSDIHLRMKLNAAKRWRGVSAIYRLWVRVSLLGPVRT